MKRDKSKEEGGMQEKIAHRIVAFGLQLQQRWAVFMHRCYESFTVSQKKLLLATMVILFAGSSLYLVVDHMTGFNKNFYMAAPMKSPSHILKTGEPERGRSGNRKLFNPSEEFKKIEQLKHYRDSIFKIYKSK